MESEAIKSKRYLTWMYFYSSHPVGTSAWTESSAASTNDAVFLSRKFVAVSTTTVVLPWRASEAELPLAVGARSTDLNGYQQRGDQTEADSGSPGDALVNVRAAAHRTFCGEAVSLRRNRKALPNSLLKMIRMLHAGILYSTVGRSG